MQEQNEANNPAAPRLSPLTPPDGWTDRCAQLGVSFEPGEVERLGHYLALLLDENTRMNLTAIRDPAEAWERHILDALTLLPVLGEVAPAPHENGEGADRVEMIDVGSGGGVPGIPLAIVLPSVNFTLLDSTAKKTAFLERTVKELGLTNVRVVTGRAEALGQDRGERVAQGRTGGFRDRFDAVIARAVGRMATLAEITVPMARVGGLVVMIKGQKADEELTEAKAALHLLHAAHSGTIDTPTGRVVVLEKLRNTPRDYPRKDGEPKRVPLGVAPAPKQR
ncbi:MAG: 16S rRNA (guanine527-N7)-methyltransferase [Phycisphaerales bacterium]|jgi:16S rRNA (guanine527-N7)-methyltransferase